ncbi:GNAT family N-acetyltransferase [Halovenus salina]|uniref:GNAT family N-acetyltransferase n=1 Tax=Halovenus salina TaxID=1510225 RepID=A0ABD5VUN2_9EURY|nr:GNAT family N-acetyltransferase [Halovenus salina]
MEIRLAAPEERPAVRGVVDAGLLELDSERLSTAIEHDEVLVAVSETGTVVGALVLEEAEILAVAVRKGRQGQEIGTKLVEEAATHHNTLSAEFHERVRPFWESLGFEITTAGQANRYRGELSTFKRVEK